MYPKRTTFRKKTTFRKRRTIPSKRATIKKAFYKRSSTRIKKVVNQVLAKKVETKVIQLSGGFGVTSLQTTSTQANFDAQCVVVTPIGATSTYVSNYAIIGNGVGQDQRVGDEIKVKGQYIHYLLQANTYNASLNPSPSAAVVDIWVLKPKVRNQLGLTYDQIVAGANANFFENQINATSGLSGSLTDYLRKVDTDNYQILAHRQHKVGWQGTLNTTGAMSSYPNNDFKQFIQSRIKLKGYTLKFDRNDAPQTVPVYLFATVCRADGISLNTTHQLVSLTYNISTYYTDM